MIAAALLALLLAACEKPDASYVTSPSVLSILGTTDGTVTYHPEEPPPAPVNDPPGWKFDLGNARYEKLENFTASIQVVALLVSEESASMQMWIHDGESVVWHWEAGEAGSYSGTLCFQIALEDEDQTDAVPLLAGVKYTLTMAFFDAAGSPVAVQSVAIAGETPRNLDGRALPGPESRTGRSMLACPRAPL